MDSRERYQIGLELVQVDVQRPVESQRGSDGRNDLSNESVEVGEGRRSDAKVSSADVVDTVVSDVLRAGNSRFVVDHERTVRVLEGGVGGQDRVVWLDNGCRHFGGRVDREFELGLLAVIG